MKKTLIALSIFAFLGSVAIASTAISHDNSSSVEMTDGGKDKKKKKCADDCAKECCAKTEATKASCTKDASKSCCAKKKAKEEEKK